MSAQDQSKDVIVKTMGDFRYSDFTALDAQRKFVLLKVN